MNETGRDERWRATVRLALIVVGILCAGVLFFLSIAGTSDAAGFPFGLVIAAIGLPLAGVVLVFRFAARQATLDRRYGLYED